MLPFNSVLVNRIPKLVRYQGGYILVMGTHGHTGFKDLLLGPP
jgi:nucleotide-binding universal stress UspA family protein